MPSYTITEVSDRVRDWKSGRGDAMRAYRVTMKADDGTETTNVEWSRKESSDAPTVGQKVDGAIDTTGQYGPKFKAEAGGGFRGGGGGRPRDPAESAAIQRQHSQDMALMYVQVKATAGQLPEDFKPEHMRPIIDWFENDIAYHALARKGLPSSQFTPPPVT